MKKVQVLMSAYNGARYLPRQLDSILSQTGVEVALLVRDDGSEDETLEILSLYEKRYSNISVYTGNRKGAAASFYDLLMHADLSNGYYAFADQDDVWRKDKLFRAVFLLERQPAGQPLLYAGKVIYASQNLGSRQKFAYKIRRGPSFGNALMENICMGCTEVFNRRLLKLARSHLPQEHIMHDWWMYLTAAFFGKVVYDQQAYVLYRQHGKNQIGMQNRWDKRWLNRLIHIRQMKHKLSRQAEQFRHAYLRHSAFIPAPDYTSQSAGDRCRYYENLDSLLLLCSYKHSFQNRCRIFCNRNLCRQNYLDDVICRLLFLAGFL